MADWVPSTLRRTLQSWFGTAAGFEGVEQASTPANPASGLRRLYPKATGWYDLDDGGVESQLGAGSDPVTLSDNDGRLELTTADEGDQITWTGYRITLWNPTAGAWEEVIPSSAPTLSNCATDLDSATMVNGYNYDVFAEYSSATAFSLVVKKWTNGTTRAVSPALWHGRYCYDNTTDNGKKRLWLGTVRTYQSTTGEPQPWATSTAYALGALVTNDSHYFTCYKAHTSGASTEPGVGASWADYWQDQGVITDERGVFIFENERRFILNAYNQRWVFLGHLNPYTSTTSDVPATSWEGLNSSSTEWKIEALFDGVNQTELAANCNSYLNGGADVCGISIGMDSNNTPHSQASIGLGYSATVAIYSNAVSVLPIVPTAGYHYFLPLQSSQGSNPGYMQLYTVSAKTASFGGMYLC